MIILKQVANPATSHPFDLTDRGLLLADGVFDTSLVANGRVFLREAHLDRLMRDALALDIHCDRHTLEALMDEIVQDAGLFALRLTVTRGAGGRGLIGTSETAPTLLARLDALAPARQFSPVTLRTAAITRNPDSVTTRHKTLAYTDNIMAARHALQAGHDEALMLNTQGRIACASSANIFARFGKRIVTPPVSEGALAGVMRAWLLDALSRSGFDVAEAAISVSELANADQVFATNSLRLIAPVSRIDAQTYDDTHLGALVDQLKVAIDM